MDHSGTTPNPPNATEASTAREAGKRLAAHVEAARDLEIRVVVDGRTKDAVALTPAVARLLVEILNATGEGNAVSVIPVHAELTTQQAADLLNVSRPFLIQLLLDRKLPYRTVGTHRRIRYRDLVDFKNRIDAERNLALDELAAETEALGIRY